MSAPTQNSALQATEGPTNVPTGREQSDIRGAWAFSASVVQYRGQDPLLTAEDVARRLNVSTDWVWDHSSQRSRDFRSYEWVTALSDIAQAGSKTSSASRSGYPLSGALAGKLREPTVFPPQKLRNRWVGRNRRDGSRFEVSTDTGTTAKRSSILKPTKNESRRFQFDSVSKHR